MPSKSPSKPAKKSVASTIALSGVKLSATRRRLKARNRRFLSLTRAKQRVAIARDVIAQIAAKKLVPTSTYLQFSDKDEKACEGIDQDTELAEVTAQTTCAVCGIGSLFVAAIEFHDRLKIRDIRDEFTDEVASMHEVGQYEIHGYLKRWFDPDQLLAIEYHFESYAHVDSRSPIIREASKQKRLVMIMENIISNRGRFDPEKGLHCNEEMVWDAFRGYVPVTL